MDSFVSNYYLALRTIESHFLAEGLNLSSIVEVGSRDGLDAIFLSKYFNCTVHAFEPNPPSILEAKKNITKYKAMSKVKLHTLALSDKCGYRDFFPVDTDLYENIGASSFFLINFNNRHASDPDKDRGTVQKKIKVKIASFCKLELLPPNLLLIDAQGSELEVLKGFGKKIRNINAIVLEASFSENYISGASFDLLHNYLINQGFFFAGTNRGGGVSEKIPKRNLLKRLFNLYEPDFDCIYLKNKDRFSRGL
jgi:FkbM family methyltransferase